MKNVHLPYKPAAPLLVLYPRKRTYGHTKANEQMFTGALFVIARNNPNAPGWMNVVYLHSRMPLSNKEPCWGQRGCKRELECSKGMVTRWWWYDSCTLQMHEKSLKSILTTVNVVLSIIRQKKGNSPMAPTSLGIKAKSSCWLPSLGLIWSPDPCLSTLTPLPSFTWFSHKAPSLFLHIVGHLLPQGLCTCHSLYLRGFPAPPP